MLKACFILSYKKTKNHSIPQIHSQKNTITTRVIKGILRAKNKFILPVAPEI